jgi:NAD-dependent deacetylase
MKKILVFTGAGVSAESGIKTFRDYDGLWENYQIEDVATPEAWRKNPELVTQFYNERRLQLLNVVPNEAHRIIAELEKDFEVKVVTQNVDDLHERAGSTNIIHLHGELKKVRSTLDPNLIYEWEKEVSPEDRCEKGSRLRPHIVWFGEILNEDHLFTARKYAVEADYCIVVGTSMAVYPANEIPLFAAPECEIFLVDPNADEIPFRSRSKITRITEKATVGMQRIKSLLNA